jgi:two-component system response regulator NreC
MLIRAHPDLEVVGEAADGPGTVRAARQTRPDVVLLDLTMPGSRGTETIEQLVQLDPSPRVLVLTMHDEPAYFHAALLAGASGYIVKKVADIELLAAIRAVHRGRTIVNMTRPGGESQGHAALQGSADRLAVSRERLSRREAEVVRLLAQGYTNREAAKRLAVSVKTIETYRKRLSDKLGLKGRAELYRFTVESGLLERDDPPPGDG